MLRLPELQRRFFLGLTRGHAHEDVDAELAREIRGHGALGVADRIDVYAHMYCARLTDALAEDYPRVAEILGAEAFGLAAHAYVERHPSTQPSLRWFGRAFGDFLAGQPDPAHPGYVADLARLEWARLAVFDAPDVELFELETLRRLPADDWPTMRFELAPAVEILRVAWPVHRIWQDATAVARWEPEDGWLRVWRQGDWVFQASMDEVERTALEHLRSGDDFAGMCGGLAAIVSADEVAATAAGMVLRWIEDGLLRDAAVLR